MKTPRALWLFAIVLAVASLVPQLAQAANAWNERDLTWTAPLTCSDGSPLAQCPVTGYKLEAAGSCAASVWNALATVGVVTTYHAANLAPGTYCFRVRATSANGDSLPGPTTSGSQTTVIAPLPGPPGGVTVVAATAYEIRPGTGALTASRIGVIPLGTPCQSDTRTVSGVTYNRIDPKAVDLINWPLVLPPKDTFARCG